jgi:hypothetical protein
MKRFLIVALALTATSAFANVTGSIEFVAHSDGLPTFDSQFEVNQDGGSLIGLSGSVINLEQQKGGFQGFALGRPFNVVCSTTQCTDNGSTQMDIAVEWTNDGGYHLSGTLNFINVEATVTPQKISLSALGNDTNVGFNLNKTSTGNYSGDGVSDAYNSFTATLSTKGTLTNLSDPATFIVLMVNPFVEQQ